jgi:hypothetical protein
MSIRTTVTLDDDVLERVKLESRSRGASFRDTLNNLEDTHRRRMVSIEPFPMGYKAGLNFDDVESLVEYGEGEQHR